ncbi:putative 2-oxoglutarate dehydrogenase E1 component DHKTD1, mitochondrial [Blomia tropicalis]|nr:putative 2-oxoglutarate dehydrogenase E1 component DHKTD1, mitochondrial [Blomia tropicalis]
MIRINQKNILHFTRYYHSITGIYGNFRLKTLDQQHQQQQQTVKSDQNKLSFADQLIRQAFQRRGHELARLNPLARDDPSSSVEMSEIGSILGVDLNRYLNSVNESEETSVKSRQQFVGQLFAQYCGNGISYEFSHLESMEEIEWFEQTIESINNKNNNNNQQQIDNDRIRIATSLLQAEAFDHYLAKKFQSIKRYGGEGAETMITFVEELIRCSQNGSTIKELVIGMPHRGRLNLLVNTLNVRPEIIFRKMTGKAEFNINDRSFIGDVLSHIYTSTEFGKTDEKQPLTVTLLPNPSHLEVAGTMASGFVRGRMMENTEGPYDHERNSRMERIPIQIHGDASFTGQGIVAETLTFSNVDHWTTGGSIHLIVNNQIGYTMPGRSGQARSTRYASDPMKSISAPIIHVAGDRPESVTKAAQIAFDYRNRFGKDVAIDLVCFRRWGHNELDDATFTNPVQVKSILKRNETIPREYARSIGMSDQDVQSVLNEYNERLNRALANSEQYEPPRSSDLYDRSKSWNGIEWPSLDMITKWKTTVDVERLKMIGSMAVNVPNNFNLHQTVKRVFNDRARKIQQNDGMDWATVESLAFGSLLADGFNVRLAGQDIGRGTFSQRHAMVVDQTSEDIFVPLNSLRDQPNYGQAGSIELGNSILSEEAVLAYEYGLSIANGKCLPIWEAQFGDFFNCAQSIVDTLISSGDAKWRLQSALTLLLPHGYDGAGPEHTSARLERFLQNSDSYQTKIDSDCVNWSVSYPTTPAQYFHLLRRQMIRPYRRPLIVMAPKMLLRHPKAVSRLSDLSDQSDCPKHFQPVLDDPIHIGGGKLDSIRSVIFCSGKHYYTLEQERERRSLIQSVALIRLEQLVPFPVEDIVRVLKRYHSNSERSLRWSQEEHRNMGAWNFVDERFRSIIGRQLSYCGREELSAPAVGIGQRHQAEIVQLLNDTFKTNN